METRKTFLYFFFVFFFKSLSIIQTVVQDQTTVGVCRPEDAHTGAWGAATHLWTPA